MHGPRGLIVRCFHAGSPTRTPDAFRGNDRGARVLFEAAPCHPRSQWSRRSPVAEARRAVVARHGQRPGDPGRHGQRVGEPVGQPGPAPRPARDGHPVQRQERLPLEHRGAADLVPHPGQRQGLRRPPARHAGPGLHEPGDRRRRRPRARCRGRSASTATTSTPATSSPRRRPVLRRAVPEAGRGGVSPRPQGQGIPRQAAQGDQHGLRGRGRLRLRDRDGGGRGGDPPRVPRPQGEGRRDQHPRRADRPRLGRGEPAGRPALPGRADGRHRGQDPDRGEQGGGAGRALRRDQRADLVPDHPVEQPGRVRRGVPQEAPGRRRRQADVRRGAGRGRAGGHRHGRRRRLGRGPRPDRDRRGRASR